MADDDENPFAGLLAKYEALSDAQKTAVDRDDAGRIAREDFASARSRATTAMLTGGFPSALVDAAWGLVDGEPRDTTALRKAVTYRDEGIAAGRTLLVLSGGVGCGKSTAAAWVIATACSIRSRFLRAATFARSSRYDAEASALWAKASSLVLDDLGAEYADSKGSFLTDFDELLDTYYADRRPLIITTNLGLDEFRDRYGGKNGRIASRIREAGAWVSCGDNDLRRSVPA